MPPIVSLSVKGGEAVYFTLDALPTKNTLPKGGQLAL